MLAVSSGAAEAIKQVVDSAEVGESGGVRLAIKTDDQNPKLELSVTPQAAPGDSHIEQDGAHVYVEEQASQLLQDKVLDARMSAEGPAFSIEDKATG